MVSLFCMACVLRQLCISISTRMFGQLTLLGSRGFWKKKYTTQLTTVYFLELMMINMRSCYKHYLNPPLHPRYQTQWIMIILFTKIKDHRGHFLIDFHVLHPDAAITSFCLAFWVSAIYILGWSIGTLTIFCQQGLFWAHTLTIFCQQGLFWAHHYLEH